jgi:lysophospholipase L1-like esterase
MVQILAFGDSITYGAWDEEGGWADRLRLHFQREFLKSGREEEKHLFYNLGIPGDNTREARNRVKAEAAFRLEKGERGIFLFAFGANDAAYDSKTDEFRVPGSVFSENLRAMVKDAKPWAQKILLLGITPVNELVTTEDPEKTRKNEYVEAYNRLVRQAARETHTEFVDIFSAFVSSKDYTRLLHPDGLHPNSAGHKVIFEVVKGKIE